MLLLLAWLISEARVALGHGVSDNPRPSMLGAGLGGLLIGFFIMSAPSF